jgi:hypothetical protein
MSAELAIFLVKLLHTVVFVFASICILYVLWAGLTGTATSGRLLAAIVIPLGIGVLWWLNGRECLLSSVIYRLAGGDRTQADIFLPDWVASRIMPVSTFLLAAGAGLVLWRRFKERKMAGRP